MYNHANGPLLWLLLWLVVLPVGAMVCAWWSDREEASEDLAEKIMRGGNVKL